MYRIELYDKYTGKRVDAFAVSEDSHGYPKFLVRQNNEWKWSSAKHYITREERLQTPYTGFEKIHGVVLE